MSDEPTKPSLASLRIQRDDEIASSAPRRKSAWLWLGPLLVVIAVAIIWAVFGMKGTVTVDTASVEYLNPASAQSLLTATGYVVAQRKAEVASKATGRLEILNVEEGDSVRTGEILAEIEADDVRAALKAAEAMAIAARADLARTDALYKEAKLTYDRVKELLDRKLVSQAEFDQAEASYNSAIAAKGAAEANLQSARANADYAAVQVENTIIRAPFDGTVLTKDADVGDVVAPFASSASSKGAVVTLADMTSLEVEADVSESNIDRVRVGQKCIITLDAFPTDPYRGAVKKIVPTADRAKATVMTKVTFDQLDSRVLPEMSAKGSFLPVGSSNARVENKTVLSVPTSAVIQRDGEDVVFVVRQGTVYMNKVDLGQTYGGSVEIKGGLRHGDIVVVNPPATMQNGDSVKLRT